MRTHRLRVTRRVRPIEALILGVAACLLPVGSARGFGLEDVAATAQKLAAESYREPKSQVPSWLLNLSYDQWRDIRFRADHALWRGQPSSFQVQFFHPGLYYNRIVTVNVVDGSAIHPAEFSPSQFDYGKNDFASRVPQDLGFAGFRIHYPIKSNQYYDEVIVFLGASYFRCVGAEQVFGLSARGVAIDTAASWGEEFPYFKEFWLVTPEPAAKDLSVYALLDSPSVAGAYRFVIRPGTQTVVKVDSRLFPRKDIRKLGIAPLTSMFFHGENTIRPFTDFRPEVHDSDGLLLRFASGEWLWRPLDNPRTLQVSGFQMENPKGMGLLQRDRDFEHYQDLETRPDLRPSLWIVPSGDWGAGRVELVEIPTDSDTHDNIVAYWVPDKPAKPVEYSYTMYWYADDAAGHSTGRAVATRRDAGTVKDAHRFVVDFTGKGLTAIPGERVVHGVVTITGGAEAGELLDQQVVKNPITGGWRLSFQVRPKKKEPLELRAFLDERGVTLTETWSYTIFP